ncbi:MAG: protein-glutamine gamma-glutamyltransferase [Bryobacterales bacterium]|nr:protein-glutamine gamma-glutamyltransferase [Bryobacterales bacterium]
MPPASTRAISSVERFFQFSLLGLVASGFFALAGSRYLDRPTLWLTFFALVLRGAMIAGWVKVTIPIRLVSAAAIGYVLFYPIDFYFLSHDFFTATLHGVCFLAAIKILTAEANRDYLYTAAVAFMELIGAALLSFQPSFFGWLALYILFAIAAFTSAEIRRGFERNEVIVHPARATVSWRLAVVTGAATCGILIITAGLFLIVPRTARAAAMLFPNAPRLTGYSNFVDLGGFGEISRDTRPVMHVLSYSRDLPRNVKWRGTALSHFDGKRWSEPPMTATDVTAVHGTPLQHTAEVAGTLQRSRRDGRRLLYRVDVNSSDTGTLFIAGTPEFINFTAPRLVRTAEDSFRVLPVTGEELRYEVSAHWGPPLASSLTRAERSRYLQLPPINTRIWSQARTWAGDEGTAAERARRIQEHLRRDYKYSLESTNQPVRDPLSHFLFVTRRGYCEYFASAMAVMLRTQGIPSRVVTGFQNGYFNEVSGLNVIRASDAHAWVEAWMPLPGRPDAQGWITLDPTPSAEAPRSSGLSARINMYLDAADSMWQQWVMAYDLGHQAILAAKFEGTLRALSQARLSTDKPWKAGFRTGLKSWTGWVVGLVVILALARLLRPRWKRLLLHLSARRIVQRGGTAHDASVLYAHMLDALARRGFHKPAWSTPLEFAMQLPAPEGVTVRRFTDLYYSVRFGGDAAGAVQMVEILRSWGK